MKKVLILYNKISEKGSNDELDVLEQVNLVTKSLKELKYRVQTLEFDMNIEKVVKNIGRIKPDIIFNLVESIYNKGEFAYLPPSILSYLGIPFTGNPLIPMFNCSNKLLAKKELDRIRVLTPNYFTLNELHRLKSDRKYILKPVWKKDHLILMKIVFLTVQILNILIQFLKRIKIIILLKNLLKVEN